MKVGNLVQIQDSSIGQHGLVVEIVENDLIGRHIKVLLASGSIVKYFPSRLEIISENR